MPFPSALFYCVNTLFCILTLTVIGMCLYIQSLVAVIGHCCFIQISLIKWRLTCLYCHNSWSSSLISRSKESLIFSFGGSSVLPFVLTKTVQKGQNKSSKTEINFVVWLSAPQLNGIFSVRNSIFIKSLKKNLIAFGSLSEKKMLLWFEYKYRRTKEHP